MTAKWVSFRLPADCVQILASAPSRGRTAAVSDALRMRAIVHERLRLLGWQHPEKMDPEDALIVFASKRRDDQ